MRKKSPLIIPVENQVRELDPKLLMACLAVQRGFTVIIGSHREVDFRIASLPRSIYLCKSFTNRNLKMFQIMHFLGHIIVSWDEEALVHLPPATYFSRRLCPKTMALLSRLFAWGEENAELWRQYPHLPARLPIDVTGNPRSDLLRPEFRHYYRAEVDALRQEYGEFILINTNFNHVNAFFPAQNLFKPVKNPGGAPRFGKAGVGMSLEYAEGLRAHKQAIFEAFQALIPQLARKFERLNFVVRPHPTESQEIYHELSRGHTNVTVTNKGNIVPWLMATKAVVHNGCTTGVEAYMLNVPAISYRAVVNDDYDMGFYRLPNMVSQQSFSADEVADALTAIQDGDFKIGGNRQRDEIVQHYLAAQEGPTACQNILDVLDVMMTDTAWPPKVPWLPRLAGWTYAHGRRLYKRAKAYVPGSHAPPEFHRHRYPGISIDELRKRIERFQAVLEDQTPIEIETLYNQVFRIAPQTEINSIAS